MKSVAARWLGVAVILAAGYSIGVAQERRSGDFVIKVEGEVGTTALVCVRGCTLQGERDLGIATKAPVPTYTFSCGGAGARSCKAEVHGFLLR